ncbi:MAG: hypothetical protein AAF467_18935 [Actinomycetota bacterium]
MTEAFFPYDLDRRYLPIWGPLGVRSGRHGVTVTDDELVATFGRFRLATPRANVDGGHITSGYRWYTSVGLRMSFEDDGLTFGTNRRQGVCIHFVDKVGGVVPGRRHSALTVTVADCAGLIEAIGGA